MLVRAMAAAAQADGRMDEDERAAILKRLSQEGLSGEEKRFLARELELPLEVEALVSGIESDDLRRQVYIVSLLAIEVDTPEEKAYLTDLAGRLGLQDDFLDNVHRSFGVELSRG